jgi:iron-sulfur cluster assembly accessory protein
MITLTEEAIKAVNRFLQSTDNTVAGLRVQVTGGGCSGFQYGIKLEETAAADDTVVDFGEVKVFLDPASLPMLQDVTMDFVEGLEGSGFKFENPNAKASCGCGNSFSC